MPLGVLPFPTYQEVVRGARAGQHAAALHGRPGRASRRAHRRRARASSRRACADAPEDPHGLLDHLLDALVPAGGAADDVALLTLRNLPVPDRFSVEFASEPESLASIRSMLRRWLSHAGADDLEIAEITTACGEAATNAIEHAGTGNGSRFEVSGTPRRRGGRDLHPRPRLLAAGSARTTTAAGLELMRTLMDTRCGGAQRRGHHGQPPAKARADGEVRHERVI